MSALPTRDWPALLGLGVMLREFEDRVSAAEARVRSVTAWNRSDVLRDIDSIAVDLRGAAREFELACGGAS